MKILHLDQFSSEFYFNLDGSHYKKGTVQGVLLSLSSITLVLSYFFYLFHQYLNNLIDPQFRSQSFITSDRQEVQLDQDFIGFVYQYNSSLSVEQYQMLQNKTYLVYYPYFYYQDPKTNIFQVIHLNVTQCTSPQLQGFNCIDFSKIGNYSLVLDNSNNILSQLYINIYGCLDLDDIKKTIPDNCATQSEIDAVVNGGAASLQLRLKTQQFNTTSKEIQTNYRSIQVYSLSNQFILSSLKTQKQDTEIKQGLLIQEQQLYSYPIQYDQTLYNFDRTISLQAGLGPYNQVIILMDEIVQFTQIQYPTITQILALVNSVAIVIMITKNLGRFISQNLIKEDFFVLILRNLFLEKCLEILQNCNLISKNDTLIQIENKQEELVVDAEEKETNANFLLPNFQFKYLQKRETINFNSDNSSCIQKNKLFFDEEKEQKDQIKINSNFLFPISPQTQQIKLKNFANLLNIDKIDTISQNESLITQQIDNSRMPTMQKKESNKDQPKSNFKYEYKIQANQRNKDLPEIISKKLKVVGSNSMKKSIQNILFKFKCAKIKEFLQSKGLQQQQLNKIHLEVNKSLNIYEFYKDIIFLKKAVSMLLNQDQMAALQFVGLTDNFMNLDLDEKDIRMSYEQAKKRLSHFEKQYLILQSESLQIDYIERFLIKCQEGGENMTEVDQRIISSIYKKL